MTRPRAPAAYGTALFALLGPPALCAVLVPWLLTGYDIDDPLFPGAWLIGAAALIAGAAIVAAAMVDFVRVGHGTPAPWAAPERFVATGPYRWVRNPMYVGVVLVVVGEALVLGSLGLLAWAVILAGAFHLFVVWYEEPALARRFGPSYDRYRRDVPRWVTAPPWRGGRRRSPGDG